MHDSSGCKRNGSFSSGVSIDQLGLSLITHFRMSILLKNEFTGTLALSLSPIANRQIKALKYRRIASFSFLNNREKHARIASIPDSLLPILRNSFDHYHQVFRCQSKSGYHGSCVDSLSEHGRVSASILSPSSS